MSRPTPRRARPEQEPDAHHRVPQTKRQQLVVAITALAIVLAAVIGGFALRGNPSSSSVVASSGGSGDLATLGGSTSRATGPAASSSSTEPPATTTTEAPQPKSITMAFAGDLLPHGPLVAQAARNGKATDQRYDFDAMLGPMQPVISGADLAICHMETPVSPDQDRLTSYPAFGGPVELVDAAQHVGYDGCSTGSNHSLDRGLAGITATLDRFDEDGLGHTGTARSAEEAAQTRVYDVKGVKVAHLSYAYGFNGYKVPADAPWAANEIDVERIHAAAKTAREEGADLVVLSLHFGTEYRHEPDAYQRDTVAQLLPSPNIDLIVGHHAHVVQPIGQVEGTYVIWGLGNQLANQPKVPKMDGLTAIATATRGPDKRWHVTGVEGVPTFTENQTYRVHPIVAALADPATPPGLRSLLEASYDRSVAVVLSEPAPGITVAPKP